MSSFYVIQGNDQGRSFEIGKEPVSIGRDPSNTIQLRDAEVSRQHAQIVYGNGIHRIIDGESVNGVFVNNKRYKERVLNNGDQVRLGQTLLLFAVRPGEDSTHPPYADSQVLVAPESITLDFSKNDLSHVSRTDSLAELPLMSEMKTSDNGLNSQTNAHLKMMYHSSLVISQTLDINLLLHRILELIFQWVRVDRGCIFLFDPETYQLSCHATRCHSALPESIRTSHFTVNMSLLDYVLKRRGGVLSGDAQNDIRWIADGKEAREIICVPMIGRYGFVGIIYIDTVKYPEEPDPKEAEKENVGDEPTECPSDTGPRLTDEHLKMMVAIAHQAALAVEDTRYYKGMVQGERLATIGQMVTTLSHHIKNILQGISGGSHLIQMGLKSHDEPLIQKGWGIVAKNQTRISQLILDMLTFSKEREPAYEFASIQETLNDVRELMEPRAEELHVRLDFVQKKTVPDFFYDVEQIHRAVTNVVTNAIDAAGMNVLHPDEDESDIDAEMDTIISVKTRKVKKKKEGIVQIILDLDKSRSMVLISVVDNGPGIPTHTRESLFRPFFSGKKGRGTGLGLPVAYKIIKEHGGQIRISDPLAGGTCFTLEVPLRFVPGTSPKTTPSK